MRRICELASEKLTQVATSQRVNTSPPGPETWPSASCYHPVPQRLIRRALQHHVGRACVPRPPGGPARSALGFHAPVGPFRDMPPRPIAERIRAGRVTVGVIGLGYVGLPHAVECARAGLDVAGFDVDAAKIAQINA